MPLFPRMVDNENSSLYVISESPDSGAVEYLQNGLNEISNANHHFQLPQSSRNLSYDYPDGVSFFGTIKMMKKSISN